MKLLKRHIDKIKFTHLKIAPTFKLQPRKIRHAIFPLKGKKIIIYFLILTVLIAAYVFLLALDVPKSTSPPLNVWDKRFFSVGTSTNISQVATVENISFSFYQISQTRAEGTIEVTMKNNGSVNTELLFELPNDAELKTVHAFSDNVFYHVYTGRTVGDFQIYNTTSFEIKDKAVDLTSGTVIKVANSLIPNARIVHFPVSLEKPNDSEDTVQKKFIIAFSWPSFSWRIGYGKYFFDLEAEGNFLADKGDVYSLRPIFYMEKEPDTYVPIESSVEVDSYDLVSKIDYTLTEVYPPTSIDYGKSAAWSQSGRNIDFHLTGTYQDEASIFSYEMILKIFPFFAGALTSLLLREIIDYLGRNKQSERIKWIEPDYS